jgi:hypothetical protein
MRITRGQPLRTSKTSLSRRSAAGKSSYLRYPAWQIEYHAALLELNPEKLSARVADAEAAIFKRLQALSKSGDAHAEHQAIEAAVAALLVIKGERLAFPEWESGSRRS